MKYGWRTCQAELETPGCLVALHTVPKFAPGEKLPWVAALPPVLICNEKTPKISAEGPPPRIKSSLTPPPPPKSRCLFPQGDQRMLPHRVKPFTGKKPPTPHGAENLGHWAEHPLEESLAVGGAIAGQDGRWPWQVTLLP